jgi:hypothetical protein
MDKKPKHPRRDEDVATAGFRIVQEATGQIPKSRPPGRAERPPVPTREDGTE